MSTATAVAAQDLELSAPSTYNKSYVWMVTIVAALGGLLFGYDFVVIGGAKPFYEKYFNLTTPAAQGWAMSSAIVGCLIGAMLAPLSDRFGRKKMLIASSILFTASAIGTGLANTIDWFNFWRIVGGVGIGFASTISPLYIAEVSPAAVRGRLVSINQFTIVIGILLAQIVNLFIAEPVPAGATSDEILNSWNGQTGWRWMFEAENVPAVLFIILAFMIPESPRWLVKAGRIEEAKNVLNKIFPNGGATPVLRDIESTLNEHSEKVNWRALFEPRVFSVLTLGVVLALFQQWCGINVIFNYADEIFRNAGYTVDGMLFNIVITGAVNVIFTIVSLAVIDKWGRRPLMLFGSASLAIVYALLGACYAYDLRGVWVLSLVLIAIACFAVSLGPVVWVAIAEIFPNRVRGLATSIAVASLWIGCFTLTYTFPGLNASLGAAGTFWIYSAICVLGLVYCYMMLPETKGKTLEEIERTI